MTTTDEAYDALTERWKELKARKDHAERKVEEVEREMEAVDRQIDEVSEALEAEYQREVNTRFPNSNRLNSVRTAGITCMTGRSLCESLM